MSCKPFKTTEANAKSFLRTKGAIDNFLNILDISKFRQFHGELINQAKKYIPNFSDKLFYEEQGGKKAIPNTQAFKDIDKAKKGVQIKDISLDSHYIITGQQGTLFQKQTMSSEGQIASEKTIRDLAARMSDRIGIPVRFISDRSQEFKGRIAKNLGGWSGMNLGFSDIAEINLAYATLDTPIHEILGHPIIRAIKFNNSSLYVENYYDDNRDLKHAVYSNSKIVKIFNTKEEANDFLSKNKTQTQLYQNLLKELEYGKGKEVLDRIKRDYVYKDKEPTQQEIEIATKIAETFKKLGKPLDKSTDRILNRKKYTLEEQQEEALVELLGLMTAEKLDAVKDGKLISLLKRLLKEMKQFVRSLLNQKEVEIDKLPDNMTISDLSDLLAYSNSKLILPGYEVEYTTPDNNKFKTYQEASNHISELAKNVKDVDLDKNISVDNIDKEIEILQKELDNFKFEIEPFNKFTDVYTKKGRLRQNYWARKKDGTTGWTGGSKETLIEPEYDGFVLDTDRGDGRFITKISDKEAEELYYAEENKFNTTTKASREKYAELETKIHNLKNNSLKGFIEKNKEYEQSKEIIEEWKKVNNIQYNPEEIYSRGQEFSSVVGAYSNFDVNLMMQNLLSHIEDNEKAGGKFAISAYTKPVDKQIGHLEGGGGKIKFKIYPQPNDILWAANTDVYSGSVWDASEKVNKDKKSELLGVSYTKYPSLSNVNTVQPNLANIVDNLNHHHNELGIVLTGNNFRLEYDEDIPYTTKKIIDGINKILDQKYGKLVKPEINVKNREGFKVYFTDAYGNSAFSNTNFNTREEAQAFIDEKKDTDISFKIVPNKGIQPTQTNETLKESINSVRNKLGLTKNPTQFKHDDFALNDIVTVEGKKGKYKLSNFNNSEGEIGIGITETFWDLDPVDNEFDPDTNPDGLHPLFNVPTGVMTLVKDKKQKEYTSQALINTKIAALKEVAKKYPRSLIRSEVKRINTSSYQNSYNQFDADELPFQKISKEKQIEMLYLKALEISEEEIEERIKKCK